jgi:hypothetical protein
MSDMKRRGRNYELGQRNPATLPGVHRDSETVDQNESRSSFWRSLRKQIQAGRLTGAKY